jgi:hypothetical protein
MKNDLIKKAVDFFKLDDYNENTRRSKQVSKNFAKNVGKIVMEPVSRFAKEGAMAEIINESCIQNEYNCILIEHIPTSVTLSQYVALKNGEPQFWKFDIINILFQIYSVLSQITDVFTHYDLHSSNVLLYLSEEKNVCIEMRYHLPEGEIVVIHTNYIAKLIDYGRSFFYDGENMNSNKYHDMVCEAQDCQPNCGNRSGYDILNGDLKKEYILPQKRNHSHDLRLWNNIVEKQLLKTGQHACPTYISDVLNRIQYSKEYGTPELENGFPDKINTVHDAYKSLLGLVKNREFRDISDRIGEMRIIGVLDVWLDGTNTPMAIKA